jgi:hypothetical protein
MMHNTDLEECQFCCADDFGKTHSRNQVGFADASITKLNLGNFDWTVEFWLQLNPGATGKRSIFELGSGQLWVIVKSHHYILRPVNSFSPMVLLPGNYLQAHS